MEYPYQFTALLSEAEMKAIEQAAREHNVTRTEVIRLCVDNSLEIKRQKA